ncbi:MAG: thiamine-phosphate kinase [Tatlockia sp.]|nr:thiamine-phosphate kinase [Tatlockia sp.]
MNEFSLIDKYFKSSANVRDEVIFGLGDDAACLEVPPGKQLLISTDTLVAEVHFLSSWNPYDIACKAVRVNVSDIAAMAAKPCWLTLALTLPELDQAWLARFSQGLHDSLKLYDLALIGGDTTHGPLSMTLGIFGLVASNKALRRNGAKPGDRIYVSGDLGAAALAVVFLAENNLEAAERKLLQRKLRYPNPRVDLVDSLQECASSAIDISDGLSADLNHICEASNLGACLKAETIPIHPLVKKYQADHALNFALSGGDDYELCFTIPLEKEQRFLALVEKLQLRCYSIGQMEEKPGLRMMTEAGEISELQPKGYSHF